MQRPTLVTAPVVEPLTVAEAKNHLRVEHNSEDDGIEALIASARSYAERVTGRQLITATWRIKLNRFPCGYLEAIEIPIAPLLTVVSVKYRDPADVLQTLATSEYVVDAPAGPYATTGRVYLALNKSWPAIAYRPDAVEVEFTAGYGPAAVNVPEELRQALLLLIEHWYGNRSAASEIDFKTVPFAAESLLSSFTRVAGLIR